jgi:hypothetical protein
MKTYRHLSALAPAISRRGAPALLVMRDEQRIFVPIELG